jgi:hypothetical protein
MKTIIFTTLLILSGCGKINANVSGGSNNTVGGKVEVGAPIWIAFRKMYEEKLYICQDNYPDPKSEEYLACKKAVALQMIEVFPDMPTTSIPSIPKS